MTILTMALLTIALLTMAILTMGPRLKEVELAQLSDSFAKQEISGDLLFGARLTYLSSE